MIVASGQDLRNVYEKFYNSARNYLWPFDVLQQLANVEDDIYTAFINVDKLRFDFDKLKTSMKDVLKEDDKLSEHVRKIDSLIDAEGMGSYFKLPRVNEVDPEKPKVVKTIPEKEGERI